MPRMIDYIDAFWKWTGRAECLKNTDISMLSVDPTDFPLLSEMVQTCTKFVNKPLSDEEVDAFLICMAIDNECECILDHCKTCADHAFLLRVIPQGIIHPQSEARWQMAELLRQNIPGREKFLSKLLADADSYVRQRARNVKDDIV